MLETLWKITQVTTWLMTRSDILNASSDHITVTDGPGRDPLMGSDDIDQLSVADGKIEIVD